jgi:fluoride ion exporter CrcB/FEX
MPRAPWWSLGIVNVIGSAAVGVLAALPETFWTYPLMVGLAGGLTTFSTLAVLMVPSTTENIARRALWPLALHLGLGISGCALGFVATQAVL